MNIWMTQQEEARFVYTSWRDRIFLLIATHLNLANFYARKKNFHFVSWKGKSWNLHSAWTLILAEGPFHGGCGGKNEPFLCCLYGLGATLACADNLLQLHGVSEGMAGRSGLPSVITSCRACPCAGCSQSMETAYGLLLPCLWCHGQRSRAMPSAGAEEEGGSDWVCLEYDLSRECNFRIKGSCEEVASIPYVCNMGNAFHMLASSHLPTSPASRKLMVPNGQKEVS